jgi:hypothetical protein
MSGLFNSSSSTNGQQTTQAAGIRVQTSIYGRAVPIVYGTNRISGNLIWYGNFTAIPQSQKSGGKGGGGSSTSYTYTAAVEIALCEGPILNVGSVWASNNVLTGPGQLGFIVQGGTYPQSPWSYLSANYPSQALAYNGVAYVAASSYPLGSSASLPNLSFEVFGLFKTAEDHNGISPDVVIADFLTNPYYGCGFKSSWLGSWTQYANYCGAQGLFICPVVDSQTQAQQLLQDILDSTNANCYWSEGLLKIVSYGDISIVNNGYTYTANDTPVYALTDDNFIFKQGQDPVQISRSSPQDAYNDVSVECVDWTNNYATFIAEAKDQYAVATYGLRPDNARQYHHFIQTWQAQLVAQTLLQRDLYIRNTYQFKLGWIFCGLEPMDLVTLTDTRMGMSNVAVRITAIEEDSDGVLTFTAEEFPQGVATPATYSNQVGSGANINFNVAPPNINPAIIFEPPYEQTQSQLEVWAAVSAPVGSNWGGCHVWGSWDGNTFEQIGTISSPCRMGVLSAPLAVGADPDLTNTLSVDLTEMGGQLLSGTQNDADTGRTICWVDGEMISYETATLTATSKYNLTYLRRGQDGTSIASHLAGAPFARIDSAIFQYPYQSQYVGKPLYLKFTSFNQYGGAEQTLSSVPVYTYNIQGIALASPIASVTGLTTNFVSGISQLYWQPVVDIRPLDYEVRLGPSWFASQTLGRTTTTTFQTQGDGTYWVAAHYYYAPLQVDIYSPAVEIVVAGSILVQNVVDSFDEAATGFTGTVTGGLVVTTGGLEMGGTGNVLAITDYLNTQNLLFYGGIATSGSYALPSGHAVNCGRVVPCSIRMSYTAAAQNVNDNILALSSYLAATDILDAAAGQYMTVTPQIALAQANGIYGAWQNYLPGTYNGQFFKAQILVSVNDPNGQTTAIVSDVTFAVDVPDRIDSGTNIAVGSGGLAITYTSAFNGGPNNAAQPNVQITVLNASQGDTVSITGSTLAGFTVSVLNGGVGVARNINWIAQGF